MRTLLVGVSAAAFMSFCAPGLASAQSLSVTLIPSAVTFTLSNNNASNPGSVPLVVTTTWTLLVPGRTVSVFGYFSDSATALAHTSAANNRDIPSSRVEVSVNGGSSGAFDQTVTFGGASAGRLLFSQVVTVLTISGVRSDSLVLNINLSGLLLPADTYSGVLRVRARVSP
jgi:hypothetical protein